jgi:hypothetical protein
MNNEEAEELQRCIDSPYYFATKYFMVTNKDGEREPFTTHLSEKQFNEEVEHYKKCKVNKKV